VVSVNDDTVLIRHAGYPDVRLCADVLATAFQDDPVSSWLFPDPADRARRQPRFFELIVISVLAGGEVHVTANGDGVALWQDMDAEQPEPPPNADEVVREALGPNFTRFSLLERYMRHAHPHEPHAYLPFIAVLPHRHGHGVGAALLNHKLAELDQAGRPAYLEASSTRSQALYRRAGFTERGEHIALPKGPPMYPMWREPETERPTTTQPTD
jgi:ribosomal protein S18 acetylase RimI-like enzyme